MAEIRLWPGQPRSAMKISSKLILFGVVMLFVGLIEIGCWLRADHEEVPAPEPVIEAFLPEPEVSEPEAQEEEEVELHQELFTVGKLIIVQDRIDYVSGEMTLEVPKMNFSGPVLAGPVSEDTVEQGSGSVPEEVLEVGVGLFGFAQMPSQYNANVSIAGHRDIYGEEFYDIDKIGEGDQMYLTYQGKRYTYEFYEREITDPTDWKMIRVRDFSCLTLQSCDPIGVASHRIFVVGKLVDISDVEQTQAA